MNLSFGGVSLALPVEVVRADYDLGDFFFVGDTVVYDGSYRTLTYSGELPVGLDGIPLCAAVSGGGTEVGSYSVVVTFFCESSDYNIPEAMTATLTVEPAEAVLTWSSVSFVYDGTVKTPVASYVDVFGVVRYPAVSGGAASAGRYTAVARADKNYSFRNDFAEFTVERADYDFSGVYWIGGEYVYDGSEKTVTVAGLPSGVSAIGYTDARARNAGSYVATAALSYDTKNYNPPPAITYAWSIGQGEYDTSGYSFVSTTVVFDGRAHYPTLVGDMPTGADGITLEYEISRGVTHVSDSGDVVISFFTRSENYKAPNIEIYTVTVLPLEISVVWGQGSHVYDGVEYAPSAYSALCSVSVSGGGINAGEYIAYAVADNTDYMITNDRMAFVISKAQNFWVNDLTVQDIYEGQSPSPKSHPSFGSAEYLYFSDAELRAEAEPAEAGVYYVVAVVPESENYLPMESTAVAFRVIEVVPIAFEVAVSSAVIAFRPIDNCVIMIAKYNDGSELTLSADEVEIEYQSADSPRVGDSSIAFRWSGFEQILSVTVEKGKYDMSSLVWTGTEAVYDGTEKFVALVGLPEGVSVREYVGNGAVNAGEYTVVAYLDYDTANYEAPEMPFTVLSISKMQIPLPQIESAVYSGGVHIPTSDSPYYTFNFAGAVNAGEYTLTAEITDSANYCFVDGAESAELTYSVLARPLTVLVDGIRVYRDGVIPEASYTLTEGSVIEGDSLSLIQRISDGRVILVIDNANYTLQSLGGEIEYLDRLSPEEERRIILTAVLTVLAVMMIVCIILMRGRIVTLIAIIRCRYANRRPATEAISKPESVVSEKMQTPAPPPSVPKGTTPVPKTKAMPPLPISLTRPDSVLAEENNDVTEARSDDAVDEITVEDIIAEPEECVPECEYDATAEEGTREEATDTSAEVTEEEVVSASIDVMHADALITDSLAKDLVQRGRDVVYTGGSARGIVNVDTLSKNFDQGDRIDVNILKKKSLIPYDTAYLKVLARGSIDKALTVYANEFSLSAVKMIVLAGGEAIRVATAKEKQRGTDGR